MRKIVTSYINPPIPYRNTDWCAYFDGDEETGNYGYGTTEAEAIADFLENCVDPEIVAVECSGRGYLVGLSDGTSYPTPSWSRDFIPFLAVERSAPAVKVA